MKLIEIRKFLGTMSFEKISELTRRSIPPFEIELLYRIILKLPFEIRGVVEVGTYRGWSALWLAAAAQERRSTFCSIDIDSKATESGRKLLHKAGLSKVAVFRNGDSGEVVRKGNYLPRVARPNVWLIDGYHSYEKVFEEVLLAISAMGGRGSGDGVIFLDDASVLHPDSRGDGGVPRALQENGGFYLPGTLNRIGVIKVGGWKF